MTWMNPSIRHFHLHAEPSVADPSGQFFLTETDSRRVPQGTLKPVLMWTGWKAQVVRLVINLLLPTRTSREYFAAIPEWKEPKYPVIESGRDMFPAVSVRGCPARSFANPDCSCLEGFGHRALFIEDASWNGKNTTEVLEALKINRIEQDNEFIASILTKKGTIRKRKRSR